VKQSKSVVEAREVEGPAWSAHEPSDESRLEVLDWAGPEVLPPYLWRPWRRRRRARRAGEQARRLQLHGRAVGRCALRTARKKAAAAVRGGGRCVGGRAGGTGPCESRALLLHSDLTQKKYVCKPSLCPFHHLPWSAAADAGAHGAGGGGRAAAGEVGERAARARCECWPHSRRAARRGCGTAAASGLGSARRRWGSSRLRLRPGRRRRRARRAGERARRLRLRGRAVGRCTLRSTRKEAAATVRGGGRQRESRRSGSCRSSTKREARRASDYFD
jgi:hypothetical protein